MAIAVLIFLFLAGAQVRKICLLGPDLEAWDGSKLGQIRQVWNFYTADTLTHFW